MAQQQRINQCIADGANANLQLASVSYQCAEIQPDHIITIGDRHFRRTEDPVLEIRIFQHQVKASGIYQGFTIHERQVLVDLANEHEGSAIVRVSFLHQAGEIEGYIGI